MHSSLQQLISVLALVTVAISLVPVVFPALLVVSLGGYPNFSGVNPFELGSLSWKLVAVNVGVLVFGVLYRKRLLPLVVIGFIKSIPRFEISRQVAILCMLIILGSFISLSVSDLFKQEPWEDYPNVIDIVNKWDVRNIIHEYNSDAKSFLLLSSNIIFHNYRVVPFLTSVAVLVVTYFLSKQVSGKRLGGVIAVLVVLQSNIFLTYDSSPTYETSWVLFYLVCLYLITRKSLLSPLLFLTSVFSKLVTAFFLPMTFFFIYESLMPRKRKIIMFGVFGVLFCLMIVAFFLYQGSIIDNIRLFSWHDFVQGLGTFAYLFRFDELVLFLILPLVVCLAVLAKRNIPYASSVLVLISGMVLLSPLLLAMTNLTNQPYRFLPLVVFFAMGVSLLLANRSEKNP